MTQYKNKKPRTVNFYHIEGKDETLKKLDDKISTTYNLLKTHHSDQIETIEMGDNKYYIYSMNKAYVDESGQIYAWLINLSRLDPTSPIQVGDMKKNIEQRNETLPITDDQGSVVNTQFLYDTHTHICAFARTAGGVNKALFKSFLLRFCKIRGLNLAIVPDEIAINKLDKMQDTSLITYSVAKINNLSSIKDNSRDEIKDMEYANDVGAQKMTVCLQADSLKLKDIIAKAKLLFKNSENLGITKLKVEGIDDDGVFEPVDLVQHKLVFHGYVEYDNIVTIENMFGFLEKAYHKYYDYCVRNFI
ncbi:hypothetical protein U2F58_06975 [Lactobacillus johnsonii]|uniref:hypothetical protein n=1 Tax=Lactobacillus johnsonii TaxID=33959 RepID=UPI000A3C12E3|nr:hypothetical protein [Lactobacillus johnsonii]OUL53578.1 hypothetical protein B2G48_05995 [Lactobacillus johnsonii]